VIRPGTDALGSVASRYEAHARIQRASADELAGHLMRRLVAADADGPIVDVGAGTGLVGAALRRAGWDGRIAALDRSAAMLAEASTAGCSLRMRADAHRLPLVSASAAAVTSSWVLQWCEDPAQAVGELARLLRPGGWLGVVVPVEGTLAVWRRELAASGVGTPVEPVFHSLSWWRDLATAAGLHVDEATQSTHTVRVEGGRGLLALLRGMGALGPRRVDRSGAAVLRAVRRLDAAGTTTVPFEVGVLVAARELE
jgi:ubiquinone/menaquinone biosynthesis C-methylase UbiE